MKIIVFLGFCFWICGVAFSQGDSAGGGRSLFFGEDENAIMGFDAKGVPMVCGTGVEERILPSAEPGELFQEWEVVPSVLRADSQEPVYIRVRPNRSVETLRLALPTSDIRMPEDLNFHDDGLNGDLVAGDGEYSLGPFTLLEGQAALTTAPMDVSFGLIQVVGTDGTYSTFVVDATVGVLPVDYVDERVVVVSEAAQLTRNLLNVRTESFPAQEALRGVDPARTRAYIRSLYELVEDDYDMMVLLATGKIESTNQRASSNQNAGVHYGCQNGPVSLTDWNQADLYGSGGRLAAMNFLDYQGRGMQSSNLMHEIMHQWGAHFDNSLGYRNQTAHYDVSSNAGSILGGRKWVLQPDGSYVTDRDVRGNSTARAGAVDLYSMGLLALEDLHDLHLAEGVDFLESEAVVWQGDISHTITREDIRSFYGDRVPDPAQGQRAFRILFVVESRQRLLNQDEMTYYSGFAKESMRVMDEGEPAPRLRNAWLPITRFFGDEVTWDHRISLRAELFAADEDHDGDGFSSALEIRLGSDAFDSASRPRMEIKGESEGYWVEFRPYRAGSGVQMQASDDFKEWVPVEAEELPGNAGIRFSTEAKGSQFYRVRIDGGMEEAATAAE